MKRRAVPLILLACALAACSSTTEKAEEAEARYDQAMSSRGYAVARTAIREATRFDENEPRYWLKLARVQLQLGALADALEAFRRVLDFDPNNIEALQGAAELSAAGGDYDSAKDYAAQLLVLQPDDVRGRIVMVATAVRERRFDDALTRIEEMIRRGTVTDDLFLLKSRALEGLRRPTEAVALLEERDKLTPGSLPILTELAALYKRQNNAEGARRAMARLAAVDPQNADYQLAAALELSKTGQADAAQGMVTALQQANKDDAAVQVQVIEYLRDTSGDADAVNAALAAARDGSPAVKIAVARTLLDLRRPAQALALVEPIAGGTTTVDPANVDVQAVYANALAANGQVPKARTVVDRVLAFDDTNSQALLLRGRLALNARQLDRALQDAQLLVANDPGFEAGQILLADVYAGRGERTLADIAYVRTRNKFPDSPAALTADARWRIATGRPGQAVEMAKDYAKSHVGSNKAKAALIDICGLAGDQACVAAARKG